MELKDKANKRTTFHSLLWKALERASSQAINLLIQIILARLLLPEDFGGLAIMVAITNYAAIFVQSGLATAIVQKQNLEQEDVSTVLTASLSIALVLYIGLFLCSPRIASFYAMPELKWTLRAVALLLFFDAVIAVQTAVLSRKMQFKTIFLRTLLATVVSGAVSLAMAYMGCGIWSLVVHHLVSRIVTVLFMSADRSLRFPLFFSWNRARSIYAFSGKIMLTSMITGFHDTMRTMVIGRKYSAIDLAYYDKGYAYSNYVTQVVNGTLSGVLLPVFSRSQDNLQELRSMTQRSVMLSSYIMAPVLLGVAAIAEPLVVLLLTDKWIESAVYLSIFCLLRLPGCIMIADKQAYYALGKSEIILFYEIGLLILNLSMLLMATQYGVLYIAIGAAIVEYIGAAAIFWTSSKVLEYGIKERIKDIGRPILNASVMAAVVWQIGKLNMTLFSILFFQIFAGVLIYIILSIVTRDPNFKYCLTMMKQLKK